ncbi:MAG: hypothetical protein IKL89_01340 [Clostridia bacterium]|nr:hypothetical protein [Clostridia bacterium]
MKLTQKPYKRIVLGIGLCVIYLWMALGAGASIAWFTDTSAEVQNIFHFAEFELGVEYRTEDGRWLPVTATTKLLDESALYEPGYVQTVFLRVKNLGEVPFDFTCAVRVTDYQVATNVFGQRFLLHEHLRFGLASAADEAQMEAMVDTRPKARALALRPLNHYETDAAPLAAGATAYMALIVQMPTEVDNVANARGDDVPSVELSVTFTANQQH